jgi:outer membrane immunogenic protein
MTKQIEQVLQKSRLALACLAGSLVLPLGAAHADSGFYAGGSVGNAGTDLEFEDGTDFDEDDFAWKAFGGYNFDIFVVDLAVEGGYVNLGSPGGTVDLGGGMAADLDLDVDALTGFGLVGFELGPIGVFGKVGVVSWDAEATIEGIGSDDDSGTDPAYGVGARLSLGSIELRAEYELFDIDVDGAESSDLSMISAGLVWTF